MILANLKKQRSAIAWQERESEQTDSRIGVVFLSACMEWEAATEHAVHEILQHATSSQDS
jgi:hypothetical protein